LTFTPETLVDGLALTQAMRFVICKKAGSNPARASIF